MAAFGASGFDASGFDASGIGEWMQRTLGENYDRLMERRASWTPLQRSVTADETIYPLIASNPFVTGETVVIDGGYAATT